MSDAPTPIVILDTNALLDWRVFKDPAALPLAQALDEGRLRWPASAACSPAGCPIRP